MDKQRLTWNEIAEKYPDQWIGLSDIDWEDGANIRSAVVKFTGKSSSELLEMQIRTGNIQTIYTTPENLEYGMPLGALKVS